jgi:3-oxoacyl-ACP reductase-like protein
VHMQWLNFTAAAQGWVKGCALVGVNCVMVQIFTHCGTVFFSQNSSLNIHLKFSRYFVEQPKCRSF